MLHRLLSTGALLLVGLSLAAFSYPLAEAEDTANPWWMWLLVILAAVGFAALVIWWWRGSRDEPEEIDAGEAAAPASAALDAGAERVAPAEEEAVQLPLAAEEEQAVESDDLTRIEGIGPKISGVLQAAGITTYSALASASVEQIKEILGAESPNLLRLADPTTWSQQAGLAATGDWDGLGELQDSLKGGRLSESS
ncbi:helix-hairpin-helix domain-containing protein [Chloroflexota bacterium]